MTESWGYYCLNHHVRFRISSFKQCWEQGVLPCKCPLWGCGFYVYTQRYGGYPELCYRVKIDRFLTTGHKVRIFDESGTVSELAIRLEIAASSGAYYAEKSDFVRAEERRELAKVLDNALNGFSMTGWRNRW